MHSHNRKISLQQFNGKLILLATILASGMSFLDGTVVNIAIPTIQSNLHATIFDIQWIINGYTLVLSALILVSGAMGDRFGRKKVFLIGIILFVCASILCGISTNITQLIYSRVLEGLGAALMVPGSLSIINTSFQSHERGEVIGLWSGISGAIAAIGPFVGGWLVQTFNWQSIFFLNIPVGLLALIVTIKYVPESLDTGRKSLDVLGACSLFIALFGIVFGLISGPMTGWNSVGVLCSLIGGIIFLFLFIINETRTSQPLIPFSIFTSRLVLGSNLVTFFLYFALSGVLFFLVLNFEQIQKFSPLIAGLGLLPSILLISFLSGPAGAIADKIGPRVPMIIGPLLVSSGMWLFVLQGISANYFLGFLPGLLLFGLGMSIVIAPLTKSALSVDSRYSGAASGVNNAVARIAGLLAIAILGAIVLTLFIHQMEHRLRFALIPDQVKHVMYKQENQLAAIIIPDHVTLYDKKIVQNIIDDSFIVGFRWVMGICAMLALLSAITAFFLIDYGKQKY